MAARSTNYLELCKRRRFRRVVCVTDACNCSPRDGPSKLEARSWARTAEIQYNKVVCMIAITRQTSQLDREGNCLKADDHSEPQVHGAKIRVKRGRGFYAALVKADCSTLPH